MRYTMFFSGLGAILSLYLALYIFLKGSLNSYRKKYFGKTPNQSEIKALTNRYFYLGVCLISFVSGSYGPQYVLCFSLFYFIVVGITIFDQQMQIIPDYFHLIGLITTVLYLKLDQNLVLETFITDRVLGILFVFFILMINMLFEKITKRDAMGLGDLKLYGWLAVLFGSSIQWIFACSVGLAFLVCVLNYRKQSLTEAFAFGPYIVVTTIIFKFSLFVNIGQFQ